MNVQVPISTTGAQTPPSKSQGPTSMLNHLETKRFNMATESENLTHIQLQVRCGLCTLYFEHGEPVIARM